MTTPPETQDRLSPIPLRERLAAALHARGVLVPGDYVRNAATEVALTAVRDWLRQEAAELRAETFPHEPGLVGRATHIMVEQTAKYLDEVLADAIDKELNQ